MIRHGHARRLQLGRELGAEVGGQRDVLLVGHQRAARGIEVGAVVRRPRHVRLDGRRARVVAIHLPAQGLELVQGDVAGAAHRAGGRLAGGIGRDEGLGAFGRQLGDGQDVGRGVQIALRVPTHELPILGERHVALQDAGAHARGRLQGLARMLGELQGGATMTDGEIRRVERHLRA